MRKTLLALALLGAMLGTAHVARADSGPNGTLVCDDGNTYTVTGYGKGLVLHVVNSTSNFVVTYAVTSDGTVVHDAKGHQGQNVLTCTTTSPVTGNSYTFQGFFTPNGQPNDQTY